MELATNHYIIIIVLIQISICLLSAAYNCLWVNITGSGISYLGFSYTVNTNTHFQSYIISFMQWFLALMNFVSISLLVTMEMVKFF